MAEGKGAAMAEENEIKIQENIDNDIDAACQYMLSSFKILDKALSLSYTPEQSEDSMSKSCKNKSDTNKKEDLEVKVKKIKQDDKTKPKIKGGEVYNSKSKPKSANNTLINEGKDGEKSALFRGQTRNKVGKPVGKTVKEQDVRGKTISIKPKNKVVGVNKDTMKGSTLNEQKAESSSSVKTPKEGRRIPTKQMPIKPKTKSADTDKDSTKKEKKETQAQKKAILVKPLGVRHLISKPSPQVERHTPIVKPKILKSNVASKELEKNKVVRTKDIEKDKDKSTKVRPMTYFNSSLVKSKVKSTKEVAFKKVDEKSDKEMASPKARIQTSGSKNPSSIGRKNDIKSPNEEIIKKTTRKSDQKSNPVSMKYVKSETQKIKTNESLNKQIDIKVKQKDQSNPVNERSTSIKKDPPVKKSIVKTTQARSSAKKKDNLNSKVIQNWMDEKKKEVQPAGKLKNSISNQVEKETTKSLKNSFDLETKVRHLKEIVTAVIDKNRQDMTHIQNKEDINESILQEVVHDALNRNTSEMDKNVELNDNDGDQNQMVHGQSEGDNNAFEWCKKKEAAKKVRVNNVMLEDNTEYEVSKHENVGRDNTFTDMSRNEDDDKMIKVNEDELRENNVENVATKSILKASNIYKVGKESNKTAEETNANTDTSRTKKCEPSTKSGQEIFNDEHSLFARYAEEIAEHITQSAVTNSLSLFESDDKDNQSFHIKDRSIIIKNDNTDYESGSDTVKENCDGNDEQQLIATTNDHKIKGLNARDSTDESSSNIQVI
ncbi:unnamed protein product [Owenia fusiformis]|uniref:Uncharacterized protein n=1 Tax=Owenia fusiformis TaxID=6347 RepID=A0A8J1XY56_OWEFU|nr:unnamed protein product [Owenia fusiformis]